MSPAKLLLSLVAVAALLAAPALASPIGEDPFTNPFLKQIFDAVGRAWTRGSESEFDDFTELSEQIAVHSGHVAADGASSVGSAFFLDSDGASVNYHALRSLRGLVGDRVSHRSLADDGVCDEAEFDCRMADQLLRMTNSFRNKTEGKPPMCLSNKLMAAAKKQVEWQVQQNKMTHAGEGGTRVNNRVAAQGFNWAAVGENVAENYVLSAQVLRAWKASSGHRKNLLGEFTHMGAYEDQGRWSQVFAKSNTEACDPWSEAAETEDDKGEDASAPSPDMGSMGMLDDDTPV